MTEPHTAASREKPTFPEGWVEYEARCAIRNLVRVLGFEDARELTAMYLNDEATRKYSDQRL